MKYPFKNFNQTLCCAFAQFLSAISIFINLHFCGLVQSHFTRYLKHWIQL